MNCYDKIRDLLINNINIYGVVLSLNSFNEILLNGVNSFDPVIDINKLKTGLYGYMFGCRIFCFCECKDDELIIIDSFEDLLVKCPEIYNKMIIRDIIE